jgi:hypothetical protein
VGGNHEVEAVVELLTALAIQSCSAASADIIEIDLSGTAHGNCTGSDFRVVGFTDPFTAIFRFDTDKGTLSPGMFTGGLLLPKSPSMGSALLVMIRFFILAPTR